MKAITLWQPWASLIVMRLKTIETRTHNGFASLKGQRIGIHAGGTFDAHAADIIKDALDGGFPFRLGNSMREVREYLEDSHRWPKSSILCTAFVRDFRPCVPNDAHEALIECEHTKRWGLILGDIHEFPKPVHVRGHQGLWEWTP